MSVWQVFPFLTPIFVGNSDFYTEASKINTLKNPRFSLVAFWDNLKIMKRLNFKNVCEFLGLSWNVCFAQLKTVFLFWYYNLFCLKTENWTSILTKFDFDSWNWIVELKKVRRVHFGESCLIWTKLRKYTRSVLGSISLDIHSEESYGE